MHEHGITRRALRRDRGHLAGARVAQPAAQMRKPITLDDHQASRWIVEPLRLLDCCLVTDGGGACIVTSLRARPRSAQTPARIAGFGQAHSSEMIHPDRHADDRVGGARAAETAYRMAGVAPEDVDVVQLYDGFTPRVDARAGGLRLRAPGRGRRVRRGGQPRVRRGRCRATPPAGCSPKVTSPASATSPRRCARSAARRRRQVPDVEVSMVTGYGGAPHEAPPTVAYTVRRADRADGSSARQRWTETRMFKLDKPLPMPNEDTAPYWEGTRSGELRAQRCDDCALPALSAGVALPALPVASAPG